MLNDPTSTVSRPPEQANNLDHERDDHERELPRLLLLFDGRRPLTPALRLCLGGTDEVRIGRGGTRTWKRSGRTLELQLADHEISRNHIRLQRTPDNKLTLSRETVRTLMKDDLTLVVGGACRHGTTSSVVPPPDNTREAALLDRSHPTC